jgi:tetratricopeptide (TPR) repeat protein
VAYIIFRQKNQHFEDWYESIFPTDHTSDAQRTYDDILEGIDEHPTLYSVMPFNDVMRLGSEDQKRRALSRMTTRFHPRLSSAFKIALKDPSNAIRVQAATAIAKIERHFTNVHERIVEARSRDSHNSKLLYAQARFYDDYAFTGILDAELEKQNRKRALEAYRAYLQQDPNHAESWASVGRILQRSGDYGAAADWLEQGILKGITMKTMYVWYFESLFAQNKYSALRQAAAKHGRDALAYEDLPHHLRESITLWMRSAA